MDPGSCGNLVGEDWLANAASRMGRNPKVTHRASALQVGGVGRGAQQCLVDCPPHCLRRQDGSTAYTSPVVSQSGCLALLGLRTLQDNRAILDCHTKMLRFPAEGEVTLVQPHGSESFQLESAESGHFCCRVTPLSMSARTPYKASTICSLMGLSSPKPLKQPMPTSILQLM